MVGALFLGGVLFSLFNAEAGQFGDFSYAGNESGVTISKYTGNETNVVVPDVIEGANVTIIGDWAFASNHNLVNISIPQTVTNLGMGAFQECKKLESIVIPDGISLIPSWIFYDCLSLTNVTIPGGVNKIGESAFNQCVKLQNLCLNGIISTIDTCAFSGCSSLTNVSLPLTATNFGKYAFMNCESLISVNMPGGTSIAVGLFQGCSHLKSVVISENTLSIGAFAFSGCSSIADVALPGGLNIISDFAFAKCSGLTNINIPNSVTAIGTYAFWGCKDLTQISLSTNANVGPLAFAECSSLVDLNIPEGLSKIGRDAFRECSSLKNVFIPSSATNVDWPVFSQCPELSLIQVDPANQVYTNIDGVLFNLPQQALISCPVTKTGVYTIPSFVLRIGDYAFYNCTNLTGISNSASVPVFGRYVFSGCSNLAFANGIDSQIQNLPESTFENCVSLTNFTFSKLMINVSSNAFGGCRSLASIDLSKIRQVFDYSFWGCSSLTNVVFSSWVSLIGDFAFCNCSNLIRFNLDSRNSNYAIVNNLLYDYAKKILITCPGGTMGEVIISNGTTKVRSRAFEGAGRLTSIVFPTNQLSVECYAFKNCSGLTNVHIPALTVLNLGVFDGCSSLTSIDVDVLNPELSSIDGVMFDKSGTALIEFPPGRSGAYTIPNGVKEIWDGAFRSCSKLTEVTIPSSVVEVAYGAFDGCFSLKKINVADDNGVFRSVNGVLYDKTLTKVIQCPGGMEENVTLPESVTNVVPLAFADVSNLKKVVIPTTKEVTVGCYAFYSCGDLNGVYFGGDAPLTEQSRFLFGDSDLVTVYHRTSANGWAPFFAERPTAIWNAVEMPSLTVRRANEKVTISWTGGQLQVTTNLTLGDWSQLDVTSPYIVEPDEPQKFYRVKSIE